MAIRAFGNAAQNGAGRGRAPALAGWLLSFATLLMTPSAGRAESARPVDEPSRACIALLVIDATPARFEWTWFLGGGGGVRDVGEAGRRGIGALRLGGGVSLAAATFGAEGYGGPMHLRAGPYLLGETAFDGALGEGGVELSLGQTRHAQFGTFGLRLGAGYGHDRVGSAPLASVGVSWGVLSVPARYQERGACDPVSSPPRHALASGIRLFATGRALLAGGRGFAVVAGIELEPSFLLPPYSLSRLIGAGR